MARKVCGDFDDVQENKIVEIQHQWLLNVEKDDILSELDSFGEPFVASGYTDVFVDFQNWRNVLIVKNHRETDEDLDFIFPNGLLFNDEHYILSSIISRYMEMEKEYFYNLIHSKSGDFIVNDAMIRSGSQNPKETFIGIYIKATVHDAEHESVVDFESIDNDSPEKDEEGAIIHTPSDHSSHNEEDMHADKDTNPVEASKQASELSMEKASELSTDKAPKSKSKKKKCSKERPKTSKKMQEFADSVTGRFCLLHKSYQIKDLVLFDDEIERLTIAFSKVANRLAKQANEATKKPLNGKKKKAKNDRVQKNRGPLMGVVDG